MRTCIISRLSSNFNQIGSLTLELAALERLKKSPYILMVLTRTIVALWATYLLLAPPPKKRPKVAGVRSQFILACSYIGTRNQILWFGRSSYRPYPRCQALLVFRPMHIMSIPVIWFLAHRNRVKVDWCQKQAVVFFLYYSQNSKFTGLAFMFLTVPMNM